MVVSYMQELNGTDVNSTRSVPLSKVDVEQIAADALDVIRRNTTTFLRAGQPTVLNDPILFLGITATKFEDLNKGGGDRNSILNMFSKQTTKQKELMAAVKVEETVAELTNHTNVVEVIEDSQPTSNSNETMKNEFKAAKPPKTPFFAVKTKVNIPQGTIEKEPTNDSEDLFDFSNTNDSMQIEQSALDKELNTSKPTPKTPFFAIKTKIKSSLTTIVTEPIIDSQLPIDSNSTSSSNDNAYLNDTLEEAKPEPNTVPPRPTSAEPPIAYNNYKETYAEFQLPTPSKVPTERCGQCNRKVPLDELQSHADAHFAFQLSQEQRNEFRQNLAKSFVTRQPSAKKPRLGSSNTNASNSPSSSTTTPPSTQTTLLHKFLVKSDPREQTTLDDSNEEAVAKEPCSECGRLVSIDGQLEHADYHTAKRLQMEWNGQQQPQQRTQQVRSTSNNGVGSAKKSKSTLASFFKKGTT